MSTLSRIELFRSGGNVSRFHTKTLLQSQDVAQHSFNCALMANEFAGYFDDVDPHNVVMAMLLHDVPEAGIGDSPHDTKKYNPDIKAALDVAEKQWVEQNLPAYREYFYELNENEQYVCALTDQMESLFKSVEELSLGNRQMEICVKYIYQHIMEEFAEPENAEFSKALADMMLGIRYTLLNKYNFSV